MREKITFIRNIIAIAAVLILLTYATTLVHGIYAENNTVVDRIHKIVDDNNIVSNFYSNVEKEITEGTTKYLDDLMNNITNTLK